MGTIYDSENDIVKIFCDVCHKVEVIHNGKNDTVHWINISNWRAFTYKGKHINICCECNKLQR